MAESARDFDNWVSNQWRRILSSTKSAKGVIVLYKNEPELWRVIHVDTTQFGNGVTIVRVNDRWNQRDCYRHELRMTSEEHMKLAAAWRRLP